MKTLILILVLPLFLLAQTECEKYAGNPVLDVGPEGSWDEIAVANPSVLFDGGIYKMWYQGYDGTNYSIGYATSPDGVNWTKADDVNPVLDIGAAGSWDEIAVANPSVLFDGGIYKIWYSGNDGTNYPIGYATSTDGIEWTKHNDPVLDIGSAGSWDENSIVVPKVVIFENEYLMYYSGLSGETYFNVGCARSPDGVTWTKEDSHNPVLSPYYPWEVIHIFPGSVLITNNMFGMWYRGGNAGHRIRTGYATSADGLNWEKEEIYVLDYGSSVEDWDYHFAAVNSVYFDGEKYQMWYDSHKYKTSGAIGYATSLIDSTTEVNEKISVPIKYELSQNYPNPFNPSTIIKYSIPMKNNVTLKIFDVLSRQVATLVNKEQPQGNYEVEFDASNLTSGIYFYKIQASDFVETKKMILLR